MRLGWIRGAGPISTDIGLLLLRLWFGLTLALAHGLPKLMNLERFTASVARNFPLPELLAPLAMASEFFGGLLLALGLLAREAAVFVLITMLGAAFVVHASDPFARRELAFCYAFAAMTVMLAGPGRYSIDARRSGHR